MSLAGLKSLQYYVKRVSGISRRKIKLTTQNIIDANPGSTIVVSLPPVALDLSTLVMLGKATTTNSTAGSYTGISESFHLIEELVLECGGQQVVVPYNYNDIRHIIDTYQGGDRKNIARCLEQLMPTIKSNTETDGEATVPTTNLAATPFAISNWLSLGSMSPKVIDFSVWPETRLKIRLAPVSHACVSNAATTASYSISDIQFNVDVLDLPAEFHQAQMQALQSGFLEIPFQQWYSFSGSTQAVPNAKLQFQINSQSIDALVVTCKASVNYENVASSLEGRSAAHYDFGEDSITALQVRLNSLAFPEFGEMSPAQCLLSTMDAFLGLSDTMQSSVGALDSLASFTKAHFAAVVRTNYGTEDMGNRLISGLNAKGAPVNVEVTFKGTGSDNIIPYCHVATTASILIGPNRQLQVQY